MPAPARAPPARPPRGLPRRPIAHVYEAAYAGTPNWEIGRPQQAFVDLARTGRIRDPVLDVGCGTGELSLFLAHEGHDVLGIDIASRAIQQARRKARDRGIRARFLVWDALRLPELVPRGEAFGTVVDSAMFHLLGERERDRFVDALDRVVTRDGFYAVLGDARQRASPLYGITPREIEARFARVGWRVAFAARTSFERRWGATPA